MLFEQQLSRIEQKVDALMSAQDDINAAVTAITGFLTDLSNDVSLIAARLQAGGAADTAALNQVVGQLPAIQAAVDSLANPPAAAPAPAVPEPAPAPGPVPAPVTS
jgi:hypothetical protein